MSCPVLFEAQGLLPEFTQIHLDFTKSPELLFILDVCPLSVSSLLR